MISIAMLQSTVSSNDVPTSNGATSNGEATSSEETSSTSNIEETLKEKDKELKELQVSSCIRNVGTATLDP